MNPQDRSRCDSKGCAQGFRLFSGTQTPNTKGTQSEWQERFQQKFPRVDLRAWLNHNVTMLPAVVSLRANTNFSSLVASALEIDPPQLNALVHLLAISSSQHPMLLLGDWSTEPKPCLRFQLAAVRSRQYNASIRRRSFTSCGRASSHVAARTQPNPCSKFHPARLSLARYAAAAFFSMPPIQTDNSKQMRSSLGLDAHPLNAQ